MSLSSERSEKCEDVVTLLAKNRVRSSRDLYYGKRARERARVGRREGEKTRRH
jgi:hypothetical protein